MAFDTVAARAAGYSDAEIDAHLEAKDADAAAESVDASNVQGPTNETGLVEAAGKAAIPFYDELRGAAGAAMDYASGIDKNFGENYRSQRDEQRRISDVAWNEHPIASGAGAVVGAVVPGMGAARGVKTASSVIPALTRTGPELAATGAGAGAIEGYDKSTAEDFSGQLDDTVIGAGIGAAAPWATGAAGKVVSGIGSRAQALGSILGDRTTTGGFIENAIGNAPQRITGDLAASAGVKLKSLGDKISSFPEHLKTKFDGGPGDKKTDFIQQATNQEYREASKAATGSGEVPGPYSEALSRIDEGLPPPPTSKADMMSVPRPPARPTETQPQATNTGLPADIPVPKAIEAGSKPAWESPHADIYGNKDLTREKALELMAEGGKYSSDQGLSRYLSSVGRPQAESMRQPFDVTFARRTKGKKGEMPGDPRDMTAHLGVNKYVTGEGMSYDPVAHDLINIWESKNVTPEALAALETRAPTAGRQAQRDLVGSDRPGEAGYRMVSVEGISKLRPGSKRGMVTHNFTPRKRALKNLSK